MKVKMFAGMLLAAVSISTVVFAGADVGGIGADGFVVTSDTEQRAKVIVSDYDSNGRLTGAVTRIAELAVGDNSFSYADFGLQMPETERKVLLWKSEADSIEPLEAITHIPQITEEPIETEEPQITEEPTETEAPTEMPKEYPEAMSAAVKNGLIEEGELNSLEIITREQAAEIIENALGRFVSEEDNYYEEAALTCAQAYKLVAQACDFDSYYIPYPSGNRKYIGKADEACLDAFTDKNTVSAEYLEYAAAVVENGGFSGFDGKLKGSSDITAGEFLYLWDSLFGTYIDSPGTYTDIDTDKATIIRCGGVVIDGLETDKNLIIAYSVDASGVIVMNSSVTGVTSILGGANTENDEPTIRLDGSFTDVRINSPYIIVNASGAKMEYLKSVKNSIVNMGGF